MPIPNNIQREHILQDILKINREGIPDKQKAIRWALNYQGLLYPCKLVISLSNIFPNDEILDTDPSNFTTEMAKAYLIAKGFTIVDLNERY